MYTKTLIACVLVGAAAFAGTRLAQDAHGGMDPQMMAEMMQLAQPGPEHEELAKHAGEWITEARIRMQPGGQPMIQKGTSTSKAILGGRYLEVTAEGSMMGMPVESRYFLGFDRRHKEYTIVGLDTLGTYWVTGKGKKDDDGIIRMHGVDDDPFGKQVYTFEYEFKSEDEHVYRVLFSSIGNQVYEEPFAMVEVHAKRKK